MNSPKLIRRAMLGSVALAGSGALLPSSTDALARMTSGQSSARG